MENVRKELYYVAIATEIKKYHKKHPKTAFPYCRPKLLHTPSNVSRLETRLTSTFKVYTNFNP